MPTNTTAPAPHYTARLVVTRTTPEHSVPGATQYADPRVVQRDVAELAELTIRASSLAELQQKVVEHTKLVAE